MRYVRIGTAARDRMAHEVIVAEDPVAVLRDAARLAEEALKPTGKAAYSVPTTRRDVHEQRTTSEHRRSCGLWPHRSCAALS